MPRPDRCTGFAEYRDKVLELFACKGFGQVGMRELATCLGLSVGSLYHHYPSKQHLLLDLIEEFYEELLAVLGRIAQQAPGKRDILPALIQAHLTLHHEMPWHFRLAERDIGCLNEEQQQRIRPLREQYERGLFLMFRPSASLFEPEAVADAAIMARLLNSAPGWVAQHALDGPGRDELLQRFVGGAIDRILDRSAK
jgi:AcrR family transcriptional regulator